MGDQGNGETGLEMKLPPSLWAATARPAPKTSRLDSDIETDVAVVGGGFTGLRAALELARAGVGVAVCEAGEPGWGASGRNGGQVNPLYNILPEEVVRRVGPVFGPRMIRAVIESADEVFGLVREHKMVCEAEQNGWIQAAHCHGAVGVIGRRQRGWSEAGADIAALGKREMRARTGAAAYDAGILVKRGGSVQPLSYARELAAAALNAGARIYHGARAEKLHQEQSSWHVRCGRFTVRAQFVVLCTNGYSDGLCPGLAETIVPLVSAQAATETVPESTLAEILVNRETLADTRRVVFYTRKVGGSRLVFGSRGNSDFAGAAADMARMRAGIARVFPQLKGVRLEFCWGGRIARTRDHLPHLHEPAPGLLAGLGYNGRGVAMSTVMGRVLAERVLGKRVEELTFPTTPLRRIPLHRFRRIGVPVATGWYGLRDELDLRLGALLHRG